MSSRVLETHVLSQLAFNTEDHFETEKNDTVFVAARGKVKKKFLRASADSLPVSTLNPFECQHCAN